MDWLIWIPIVFAVGGSAAFLASPLLALLLIRRVGVLADRAVGEPDRWPRLSLIVPARNEADTIEAAVRSRLEEGYPNLEVVLVDDRSEDGTGAIMDRLAVEHPSVRVVHVTELPEGWLGKVNAQQLGWRESRGEFLLFSDADVHFTKGTLRAAVAHCIGSRIDHLAVLPEVWGDGFWLHAVQAAFFRLLTLAGRLWAVGDPSSSAAAGVGAFNLVRREAFERAGAAHGQGLEWIKLDVADDFALGLMMKRSGASCAVLNGRGMVAVEWYASVREMAAGLEKNLFASGGQCSFPRLIVSAILMVGFDLGPALAFLPLSLPFLPWLGALAIASGMLTSWILSRWAGRSPLPALLWPLGSILMAWIMVRAGYLGTRRGGIYWRDTFYSSAQLRAGARVKLP